MKNLFNNDYSKGVQKSNEHSLKLAAFHIKATQERFAKYLQSKTKQFTKRKQKLLLLLFSLSFGSCSITVMLYSFIMVNTPVSTTKITFPKYAITHKLKPTIRDSLITGKEYKRFSQFKRHLGRLLQSSEGRKVYDSLMQARPYLLDSIYKVDSIFLNQ
ncbi:hypothetical protein FC093_21915 [Ilyomonas limi]|uniref:Uncharacterized protein n=1 Tax=Ilyomonas limi TaxID=2575867 RepID=A0A4U3KUK0_9BACT|nr:hypothetical protein [Ilyomonas limi]TKK64707.1 hypothetical protein FC093_21915 [Ilyomonas limi]